MRVVLGIEYDGRDYLGWQAQKEGPSIQTSLTRAISRVADHPVTVFCAGRTDRGVHATNQVVHFDTDAVRTDENWIRGVNSRAPDAIRVLWVRTVPDVFHARFSATARRYRYYIYQHPIRPSLLRYNCAWTHHILNVPAMVQASTHLLGTHDFQSFRDSECQAKHAVRTISHLTLTQQGALLCMDIQANAFLQHMVRNIAGTLMEVGKGEHPPEWVGEVLAAQKRQAAGPTAPAGGLYLVGVVYPPEFGLPEPVGHLAPSWLAG
ncbi:MAG: tRNA pseudouridine(38-40) synthase TruA [Pseudomonadota bacterium]